jgi:hypothetical protein
MPQIANSIGWWKKMKAKLKHENRIWQSALKNAETGSKQAPSFLPKDKGGKQKKKSVALFENMCEDAKVEVSKRRNKQKQLEKKENT